MHTGSFSVRPAEPRLVGQLRPGHGEPEPAVVRRARPAAALRRHAGLGAPTSCPAATRGRASSPAPSRSPNLRAPRRRRRAAGAGARPARPRSTAATCSGRAGRPAPRGPDPVVRDRLRHAARDARGASTCRRRPTRRSSLYGLERGSTDGLRLAVPGRPPAGRARRPVRRADRHRLVEQLGRARRHGRPRPAGPERRPADRRPAQGPEAARDARRHAGRLDHRVRPHARTTTAGARGREHHHRVLLVVAGRRRASRAASSTARPTSYGVDRGRGPRSTSTTSTRRSCTCSASTTSG